MRLRPLRTNISASCWCQGPDLIWKNLDYSSLVIFSIFPSLSVFVVGRLISYINIYLLEGKHYIISFFSPVSGRLEFSSLEVKYLPCWFSLITQKRCKLQPWHFPAFRNILLETFVRNLLFLTRPILQILGKTQTGIFRFPNFWLFLYKRELS